MACIVLPWKPSQCTRVRRTNILERYYNAEVRLAVPEGKRISRIKWLAVYDIGSQNAFGDVYVPDDFEAPAERAIGPLTGTPAVSSKPVRLLDATTILYAHTSSSPFAER